MLAKQGDFDVSAKAVKDYYTKNKARYEVKEQVRARHILLRLGKRIPPTKLQLRRQRLMTFTRRRRQKAANLAKSWPKSFLKDPQRAKAATLGSLRRGAWFPISKKVAFGLKIGEISKPVKTRFGWHVIKVEEKKEGRIRAFDEVQASIQKQLEAQNNRTAKAKLLASLKKGGKVETFLPQTPAKASPKASTGLPRNVTRDLKGA